MLLLSWNSSSTQNWQTCSQTHILLLAVNYTISIFATSTMLPALFSTCVCLTKKLPFLPFLIFNCFNGEYRDVSDTRTYKHTQHTIIKPFIYPYFLSALTSYPLSTLRALEFPFILSTTSWRICRQTKVPTKWEGNTTRHAHEKVLFYLKGYFVLSSGSSESAKKSVRFKPYINTVIDPHTYIHRWVYK